MMPIGAIREQLIQKPEVIDIEAVGARLEHHNLAISVDNMFIDDCGDKWCCKIMPIKSLSDNDEIKIFAPSLRAAMIKAFKIMEDRINIKLFNE